MTLTTVTTVCRLVIATLLLVASLGKFSDPARARRSLAGFGVPMALARPLGTALPATELAIAAALLVGSTAWWGLLGAALLFATFAAAICVNLSLGRTPQCNCFGQVHSAPIGKATLATNVALLVLSTLLAAQGNSAIDNGALALFASLTAVQLLATAGAAAVLSVCALTLWFLMQMFQQNGRLLQRIEALESNASRPSDPPATPERRYGLALGATAPSFELPALSGERVSLARLLAAGKYLLTIFIDPDCGPCTALLPEIAQWQRSYGASLQTVVISRGSRTVNQRKLAGHAIPTVLLQNRQEVSSAYQANGTPSAVLITPEGRIASHVAAGAQSIAALARSSGGQSAAPLPMALPQRGAPAPDFKLVGLSGEPVRISQFRGQRLALLFWNPSCGFCTRMLDDLRRWERSVAAQSMSLLVISSGSVDANRQLRLQSDVALDQEFVAGRAFGVRGTPSGLVIDENGAMASAVATGAEEIFALLGRDARVHALHEAAALV